MTHTEIELKLHVKPRDLPRLTTLPALADGPGSTKALESVYYDTEDLQLRRHALSLRVRRQGRRFVQTLKAAAQPTGILDRGEWEVPVANEAPDPAAWDEAARAQLGELAGAALRPIFTSRIRRTTRLIEDGALGDALVEVAIDRGEIRTAAGEVMAVSEVELELKRGAPAALYRLALALAEAVPMRVELRTKSDRGYALAAGETPAAMRASRLDLAGAATAEQALETIVRHCFGQLLGNEACMLDGADAEGVHQARVALRRLRSVLALFRRLLPTAQHDWLSAEARWLAGELGDARNWDVFLGDLMAPVVAGLPDQSELAALRRTAEAARAQAYDRARAALDSQRYTLFVLRLGQWLEERAWRHQDLSEAAVQLLAPIRGLSDAMLARRFRRVRKTGAHFARLGPEPRHRLRIALKKLRYAVEFFRSLYDAQQVAPFLKALARLQDDLGHANDVETAARLIEQLETVGDDVPGWRTGGGIVLGWHARGLAGDEPALIRDWHKLNRARPFWAGGAE